MNTRFRPVSLRLSLALTLTVTSTALLPSASASASSVALAATPPTPSVLPFIDDDYGKALALAKQKKVPIFVEAWAPW